MDFYTHATQVATNVVLETCDTKFGIYTGAKKNRKQITPDDNIWLNEEHAHRALEKVDMLFDLFIHSTPDNKSYIYPALSIDELSMNDLIKNINRKQAYINLRVYLYCAIKQGAIYFTKNTNGATVICDDTNTYPCGYFYASSKNFIIFKTIVEQIQQADK